MALCCMFSSIVPLLAAIYGFITAGNWAAVIGLAFIAYHLFNTLLAVYKLVTTFVLGKAPDFKKKYGEWAIVTGATDGIGKAYAEALANVHGLKIVLVSRTQSKLDDVAKSLKTETKTVAVDFTGTDAGIYEKIAVAVEGLDVGVLVNNVGMGYNHPEYYHLLDDETIQNIITVNCFAQSKLTRLVLPMMKKNKRGCIISLSSFSAIGPAALMGLYGATKEFNRFLSESIRMEQGCCGITLQTIMPYFVTTKLSKIRKPSALIPTPKNFVAGALKSVGQYNVSFGCLSHQIYGGFVEFIAQTPLGFIVDHMTSKHMHSTRNRAYKKKAAAAKSD